MSRRVNIDSIQSYTVTIVCVPWLSHRIIIVFNECVSGYFAKTHFTLFLLINS